MPLAYEITFLPEGRVRDFGGSTHNYYEFESESYLKMRTTPIWCRRCANIGHGEEIEPLEHIDQQLADLANPNSEIRQKIARKFVGTHVGEGDEYLQLRAAELKMRRRWREARHASPKCILCGSMDIFVFPIDQAVPHPGGQGSIRFDVVGLCTSNACEQVFTSEGDRVARGKRLDAETVRRNHDFERRFYDALGTEDSTKKCRHEGCERGVISLSVFCKRHHFEIVTRKHCPFNE